MVSIYLHSNFSGALWKTILFLQEGRFSRSRSSNWSNQGHNVGANRKRISLCDFLLSVIVTSNLGPILHRFGDFCSFYVLLTPPYSTLILGYSICTRSPMFGSARAEVLRYMHSAVKLFSKYSNQCEKHTSTSRTDGRTDGQTNLITALSCYA